MTTPRSTCSQLRVPLPQVPKGLGPEVESYLHNLKSAVEANMNILFATGQIHGSRIVEDSIGADALSDSYLTFNADIPFLTGFEFLYNGDTKVMSWQAGSLVYKGTSYAISAGSSHALDTWLYWNETDTGVLKHDTSAPALNMNLWILGYVDSGNYFHKVIQNYLIHAGILQAGTVTATQILAGTITGTEIYAGANITVGSSAVNGTIVITNTPNGKGDSYIACGKTDFATTTNGFILGVDDSDSDKIKFYLGDTNDYLYWNGSALTVSGQITIQNAATTNLSTFNNNSGWTDDTVANAAQTAANNAQADANYASNLAASKVKTFYQTGTPTATAVGDIWFNATAGTIKRWDGSDWNDEATLKADAVVAGTIGANIILASNFVMNTTGKIYTTDKTSYIDDTDGIFLGYDTNSTSAYKMYIGNSTKHLKWSGSDLIINGTTGVLGADSNNYYDITNKKIMFSTSLSRVIISDGIYYAKNMATPGPYHYLMNFNNSNYCAALHLTKSSSNTVDTWTQTSNNTELGDISFKGSGSSVAPVYGVRVVAIQDGAVGSNFVPGRLEIIVTDTSGNQRTAYAWGDGSWQFPGNVQTGGTFKSSDGTEGATATYSIRKGDDSGALTLTVKDGLVISCA